MLKGQVVTLRPVQEEDLPDYYQHIINVENRGEYYPASIQTLAELRKELHDTGFWRSDFGLLLIVDNETQKVVGQVVWFRTVRYMSELEIGYIMYDTTARSRGGMTEAVKLLTTYIFNTKEINRLRLCIATENGPSRRVAEKSGYIHEGTQRGAAWFRGSHIDMELYAVTREDWAAREA